MDCDVDGDLDPMSWSMYSTNPMGPFSYQACWVQGLIITEPGYLLVDENLPCF